MSLKLALQAFWRTLKNPEKFRNLLEAKSNKDDSHLRLLFLLQKSARLIDFLKEDLSLYSDEQIGAAARKVQHESAKVLEEYVRVRPVLAEQEGAKVTVPSSYNPSEIKVVGKVKGQPPYLGILRHKGWMAEKKELPIEGSATILSPAEVEV